MNYGPIYCVVRTQRKRQEPYPLSAKLHHGTYPGWRSTPEDWVIEGDTYGDLFNEGFHAIARPGDRFDLDLGDGRQIRGRVEERTAGSFGKIACYATMTLHHDGKPQPDEALLKWRSENPPTKDSTGFVSRGVCWWEPNPKSHES